MNEQDLTTQLLQRERLTELAKQSLETLKQLNDVRQNMEVEARLHELLWDQVEEVADRLLALGKGLEDTRDRLIDAVMRKKRAVKIKDAAYKERNHLVRFVAHLYESWLERHPEDDDWEDDWRWIVFVNGTAGQMSWHIHDSELKQFTEFLEVRPGSTWDGHSTEEKYKRLEDCANHFGRSMSAMFDILVQEAFDIAKQGVSKNGLQRSIKGVLWKSTEEYRTEKEEEDE